MNANIIPQPNSIQLRDGNFNLKRSTQIGADEPNQHNASYLQNLFQLETATRVDDAKSSIQLVVDASQSELGKEGYRVEILPRLITITGMTTTGVFYGIQTVRQLIGTAFDPEKPAKIPCMMIEDRPRFSWRGFMLDEGRHFHGKETVKQLLDAMALLKLNIFHWHLTEDQGWRIEIKQYPRLTDIGSTRFGTAQSFWDMLRKRHDDIPHSGYYTQGDIREIVAYASDRHITVVPEIEMPGHATAALASYPEYSCRGGSYLVGTRPGIYKDVFCMGKDATFTFLENILSEVVELFPGPYIHIGGDELPCSRWKDCPDCQARMKQAGMQDEFELQTYLNNRMADYLAQHNRRMVGWNEMLQADLAKDAIVQYWVRNKKGVIDAIQQGRNVIMLPFFTYYLDHSHSLSSLQKVYNYEPIFKELDAESARNVIGVEAPLWTEWVPDRARIHYQVFPRLVAIAESAWTNPEQKSLADFRRRLPHFQQHLDQLGIGYAPATDIEPSRLKQLFGIFTIVQPQRQTAQAQIIDIGK